METENMSLLYLTYYAQLNLFYLLVASDAMMIGVVTDERNPRTNVTILFIRIA